MGRWTPLILMAGGLAILVGTLVGISFPMGGQDTAQNPGRRASQVLPANINVNNTDTGNAPRNNEGSNVAQNNARGQVVAPVEEQIQAQNNTPTRNNQPTETTPNPNEPIRALW
jgi:hypothetical protein